MFELMMKWKAAGLQILWPDDVHSLPGWKALITRILQVSFAVIRDFLEGQLTLRAMSLVYTTLLSLVPLLALTFSVLKGFGVQNQLEPALVNTLSALGDKGEEIARQIVGFVDNIKVGVLGLAAFSHAVCCFHGVSYSDNSLSDLGVCQQREGMPDLRPGTGKQR